MGALEKSWPVVDPDMEALKAARALGPLPVMGIVKHLADTFAGKSTISLGERVINEGPGWRVLAPVVSFIVDGHNYRLDQPMRVPKNAQPSRRLFPSR